MILLEEINMHTSETHDSASAMNWKREKTYYIPRKKNISFITSLST